MLGGGIVGAIISALATIFYGERWTEKSRLKREHSMTLVTQTIKPWLDSYLGKCLVGATYSGSDDKFVGYRPQDPVDLPYFDVVKQHFETGYTEILKEWEILQGKIHEHNLEVATFLDKIRTKAVKVTQLKQYHPLFPGEIPEEYIIPENVSDSVHHALRYEIINRRGYFDKPKIYKTQEDGMFLELRMGTTPKIAKAKDNPELEKIKSLINQLMADHENKQEVKRLIESEDILRTSATTTFDQQMKELIKSVELGNRLKGKCKHCPK